MMGFGPQNQTFGVFKAEIAFESGLLSKYSYIELIVYRETKIGFFTYCER